MMKELTNGKLAVVLFPSSYHVDDGLYLTMLEYLNEKNHEEYERVRNERSPEREARMNMRFTG